MAAWRDVDPRVREAAEAACTERQLVVLRLAEAGVPLRQIARVLGLSPATVREHRDAGTRRIARALAERVPA